MKLQKISEIQPTLPLTEYDFLEKYRENFRQSELEDCLTNGKKETSAAADDSNKSKEERAIELFKGLSPDQIMVVISAINKQK